MEMICIIDFNSEFVIGRIYIKDDLARKFYVSLLDNIYIADVNKVYKKIQVCAIHKLFS